MKTANEWFDTLPEPIRTQAKENAEAQKDYPLKQSEYGNVGNAIHFEFQWSKSPQRHSHWSNIHSRARNGEFDPKPIDFTKDVYVSVENSNVVTSPYPDFFMLKSVFTDAQEKLETADLNVLVAVLTDAKNGMVAKDRAAKLIKKLSNLLKATT